MGFLYNFFIAIRWYGLAELLRPEPDMELYNELHKDGVQGNLYAGGNELPVDTNKGKRK